MKHKGIFINSTLTISLILLAVANLLYGSVSIPADQVVKTLLGMPLENNSWGYIIMESRLPEAVTALFCGASLATSGLLLQTYFRNPLAGPSILGITSGASLGAAIIMLFVGGIAITGSTALYGNADEMQISGSLAVTIGAFAGATAVIVLLLVLSRIVRSNLVLLIVGIMLSYLTSAAVSLLNFFANTENVHNYVMWGMGSFSDVSMQQLPWFCTVNIMGLILAVTLIKPLNAILLGDDYAQNLGINLRHVHSCLLVATGILTAICTAFCGPIAFIGLAVPHIARLLTSTADHAILLPATILTGACLALLCNIICVIPENTIIPINAITPIFGAPVILYVIFKKR